MGFFSGLLGGKKRDARQATDDDLNAIIVLIRNPIADFKDRTKMSFAHLLPAINSVGLKLLVKSIGLESAQQLYRAMINDMDSQGGIPVGSHVGVSKPPTALEDIAELNGMLWELANDQISRGKPVEHVAQAYMSFAMLLAKRVTNDDPWLSKYLMAEAARELKIDFAELDVAKVALSLQPTGDLGEPINTLFECFAEATTKFKDASGLDWGHLLPGLQRASTIYFLKDRGKIQTVDFLQKQIESVKQSISGSIENLPVEPVTPIHITNMTKFNEYILQLADELAKETECPAGYVAIAISMIVISICATHLDLVRAIAVFASSCEDIKSGQYNQLGLYPNR